MIRRVSIFAFLLVMVFAFSGCGVGGQNNSENQATESNENDNLVPQSGINIDSEGNFEVTELDSSRVAEVEEKSGFDLPSDARIFTSVDNKSAYLFSFYTSESVEDLQAYFEGEFSSKGYTLKREWTTYTVQQYSSTTALYSKGGETSLIAIEDQNGQRLVNMTRDY